MSGPVTNVTNDWSSEEGCKELANKIKQYWKDRGKDILVWLETLGGDEIPKQGYGVNRGLFWNVRSDMINGLPK